jgi:MFS family permease
VTPLGGGHALATTVVLLGIFAPAVNTFITATVLPSVVAEIGGLALYAWATTAYAVASIVASAASSVVMRRLGTRIAFVVAAAVLAAGTAACGAAPTMVVIVAGRAIQGLGGGMMFGVVHGAVRELFPEAMWQSRLALVSGVWGVAAIGGPFIGGVLAQIGMWRTAFWGMMPIILAPCAMAWWLLPRRPPRRGPAPRVPFGRLLLICAAVLCLASVANVGSMALRIGLLAGMGAAIALTLHLDARAVHRLFPADMLSLGQPIGKAAAMIFLIAAAGSPTGIFMPLLLRIVHEVPPVVAGYCYVGQSLAWSMIALFAARIRPERLRAALIGGPLVMSLGLGGVALTIGPGPVLGVAAGLVVVGVGIGICWAHIAKIVLASAREGEGEVSAALTPSAQLFAIAFGGAVSGIVASTTGLSHAASVPVAALTGTVLFGGAALAPLAAAVIAAGLRPSPRVARTATKADDEESPLL